MSYIEHGAMRSGVESPLRPGDPPPGLRRVRSGHAPLGLLLCHMHPSSSLTRTSADLGNAPVQHAQSACTQKGT
jgi:hypothetical protein